MKATLGNCWKAEVTVGGDPGAEGLPLDQIAPESLEHSLPRHQLVSTVHKSHPITTGVNLKWCQLTHDSLHENLRLREGELVSLLQKEELPSI
jgi:hypothetical protein